MKGLSLPIALVFVTGCSTIEPPTARLNALEATERTTTSGKAKAALDDDFQRALTLCDSQMAVLRESFDGSGKKELGLAAVGMIAGSIIVPTLAAKATAAKSAIAGWGGVSGAANAAQYTLQQKGVSASRLRAVYEATRTEIRNAADEYSKAQDNSDRIAAVNKLSIACRYPQLPSVDATPAPGSGGTSGDK